MRKLFVLLAVVSFATNSAYSGGIMTNTNQSASYIRMPARDASLGIDAVYYNPAGLTRLADGIHLSLNNQSIFQNRTISNGFSPLKDGYYEGKVTAPLFPSIYAVYKTGKLAVSGGFMPVGGGGGAEYSRGLPSFETDFASVPFMLTSQGITTSSYDVDIFFEGSSIFFGGQLGVSYQLSEMIDVYGGLRYITATNTYNGYLRNFTINPLHPANPGGGMVSGHTFFSTLGTLASGAASSMNDLVAGAGALTLDQAVAMSIITQETANQIAGGLGANYNSALTISQVQGAYQVAAATATGTASMLSDKRVDARQTGSAIIPLLGVNLSLSEKLNVGIKYEFITKLELENDTEIDETGMFTDGVKSRSDMPALLSVGAAFQATPKFNIAAGMHYYFDKQADYGKTIGGIHVNNDQVIDNNFLEFALGLEYEVTPAILISGGYLRTQTGVNETYQSDLSHSLSTNSIGIGGRYALNDMMSINLGFMRTFYEEGWKQHNYGPLGTANEIYNRDNTVLAIGVELSF
ncbi:MAG: OmpP1/FadL family transporter [Bacteroidales bacterium]